MIKWGDASWENMVVKTWRITWWQGIWSISCGACLTHGSKIIRNDPGTSTVKGHRCHCNRTRSVKNPILASSVKLLDHGGPSCSHDLASTAAEGSNWSWILLLVCTFAIICVGSMRPKMTLCLLVMVALGWCLASGLIHLKLAIANGPVLSTGKTRMSEEVLIAKAFGQRFRTVVGKVDVGGFSGQPIKINGQGFLNATTLLASLLLVVAPAACLARVVLANWSASGESQVELDLVEPSEALSIACEGHPAVGPCCSCRSTDGLGWALHGKW